jgi:heavy metal sensor kinase
MTARITLAILLTTWVVLIVGETAAFLTARQILLVVFDDTIESRAKPLLLSHAVTQDETRGFALPSGDRYEIRDRQGVPIAAGPTTRDTSIRPVTVKAVFEEDPAGHPIRTITMELREKGKVTATITYSRPTERFDVLLRFLARILLLISLACGLTTAWLALKLSRAALRPLRETSETIAQIDERNLSRRIEGQKLPIELRPMTERLNELLARLERAFAQRKQFLADAAHELRTPTASLLTTLEVALRRPRDQAALVETLNSGLEDVRRLKKLVEQLMEQARSERVATPESMKPADIPALVRECIDIVTPLAAEKNIALTPPQVQAMLPFVTQRDRLRSVLLNLLSNAIEYNSPGGSVSVSCRRENGSLELVVADTGKGIAPEQLPHIFEPFYRGGNGRGDDPAHLGLGLFLVRSHVEALGGRYEIQSTPGTGTTLAITLPEPQVPQAPQANQAPQAPQAHG